MAENYAKFAYTDFVQSKGASAVVAFSLGGFASDSLATGRFHR